MNRAEMKKDSMTTFTCLWVSWISLSSPAKLAEPENNIWPEPIWSRFCWAATHWVWGLLCRMVSVSLSLSLSYIYSQPIEIFAGKQLVIATASFLGIDMPTPQIPLWLEISFTFMHWMYSCSVKPTLTSIRCRWSSSTMQATSRECSLSSWRGTWTCPSTTSPSRQSNNILGKMMEIVQAVYVQDVWMGEVAWFTTAYFVDPLVICNGGRSSL